MNNNITITKQELRSILMLSIIFSLRMSGIFMILPILTIYALPLKGSNASLIGIAIGIYGIIQIIFQLPFGFISDKIGCKPVIIVGLLISALGSEIAAITDNIWGLIIGRGLQGVGAIGSIMITLLLNLVREQYRMQAMAIIGISFGITFMSSMVLGPLIASIFGLHGLFQIITITTILAAILVLFIIPINSTDLKKNNKKNYKNAIHAIKSIITQSELLKLNCNIFCLHTILILNFIIWPNVISSLGYDTNMHFKIYAIIVLIATIITFPCLLYSKIKNNKIQGLFISINILFISELIMFITTHNCWMFLFGMQLFFIAFNLIEAILPSLINTKSPSQYKGTSISIYSIGQFLGTGLGGILGGFLSKIQGNYPIFLCALAISIVNIIINYTLSKSISHYN